MKAQKPLFICIIENLPARHEKLWFVLRDIFPKKTTKIVPIYDKPCATWKDAKKLITDLPNNAEVVVIADLALNENDINDARTGVEECHRLHQLRPDAKFVAATGFESVLVEHPKAKDLFSAILTKQNPVWDKADDSELAALLRQIIGDLRSKHHSSGVLKAGITRQLAATSQEKLVFVSHCHDDADLAEAVVDLLSAGLGLCRGNFRCTSLQGAALAGGTRTDDQLRDEISLTPSFISLLTPKALKRFYVLFELGARWGLKGSHIPLLARGVSASFLKDPLKATVALDLKVEEKVLSLVNDLGSILKRRVEPTDAYLDKVKKVVRLAKKRRTRRGSGRK